MTRYGAQFGPDITFLGVDRVDLDDADALAAADVVIVGAPFDGGTSHRPGTRFGPMAIRQTDYLPQDGSRPHLALRVDALQDIRVVDAGDVEMAPGEIERALGALEDAVYAVASAGAVPLVLGGDHSIALPDATGVARHLGYGRVSMIHFDAHADTGDIEFGSLYGHGQPMRRLIESGALRGDRFLQMGLRGYWPGPETLGWMAEQDMRSYEMTEIGKRGLERVPRRGVRDRPRRLRRGLPLGRHRRLRPGPRPGHRHPRARRAVLARAARRRPPDLPRAARRGHRRGRGVAALRPRRDHGVPRQPGVPRGALRAGRPQARHHPRPRRSAAGRALMGTTAVRQRRRLRRPPLPRRGPTCSSRTARSSRSRRWSRTGLGPPRPAGSRSSTWPAASSAPGFTDAHVPPDPGRPRAAALRPVRALDPRGVPRRRSARTPTGTPTASGSSAAAGRCRRSRAARRPRPTSTRSCPTGRCSCPTATTTAPGSTRRALEIAGIDREHARPARRPDRARRRRPPERHPARGRDARWCPGYLPRTSGEDYYAGADRGPALPALARRHGLAGRDRRRVRRHGRPRLDVRDGGRERRPAARTSSARSGGTATARRRAGRRPRRPPRGAQPAAGSGRRASRSCRTASPRTARPRCSTPYLDGDGHATDNRGHSFVEAGALREAVAALDAAGFQVHVHAIGDRGVREALDAFEARARPERPAAPHRAPPGRPPRRRAAVRRARRRRQRPGAVGLPATTQMTELTLPFLGAGAGRVAVPVRRPAPRRRPAGDGQRLAGQHARPARRRSTSRSTARRTARPAAEPFLPGAGARPRDRVRGVHLGLGLGEPPRRARRRRRARARRTPPTWSCSTATRSPGRPTRSAPRRVVSTWIDGARSSTGGGPAPEEDPPQFGTPTDAGPSRGPVVSSSLEGRDEGGCFGMILRTLALLGALVGFVVAVGRQRPPPWAMAVVVIQDSASAVSTR